MDRSDYLFMVVEDSELRPGKYTYISMPNWCFFPEIDVMEQLPELVIVVEALREVVGMEIYLGINPFGVQPYSDEIIISNLVIEDEEYLQYVNSPIGTFYLIFFDMDEKGRIYEADPVKMNDEIKETLWLRACEVGGDEEVRIVKYVSTCPRIQFPPLRPERYLFDTDAWREAREYWQMRDEEEGKCEAEQLVELLEEFGPETQLEFVTVDGEVIPINDMDELVDILDEVCFEVYDEDEGCYLEPELRDYVIRI